MTDGLKLHARGAAFVLICAATVAPLRSAAQERATGSTAREDAAAAAAAAAVITPEDFDRRIRVIADDSMRGRNTPSPELDKTAAWIAEEFSRVGLRGGGDGGGFLQRYPLEAVRLDIAASRVRASSGRELRFGVDVVPLFGAPPDGETTGGVVLVSGSMDVEGTLPESLIAGNHAVVVRDRRRGGLDRSLFRIVGALRAAHAASVSVTDWSDDAGWAAGSARAQRPAVRLADGAQQSGLLLLRVRGASLARLLQPTGVSVDELTARAGQAVRADLVEGLTLTVRTRVTSRPTSAPNVVGILEGRDPRLKDEYVVFSGHMDHVGVGRPDASGDSIYNGADDDASGTVTVIEVARAMAALHPRPRRSMIFLTVSGEEKGLWGSRYFVEHPPVALDRIVADLNADMVGRNWSDTIVAIGKEHSDLGATLARVDAAHPELHMNAIDDRWPQENFYRRSDHFNFARRGVPILFFFNGTHEDYHRPGDEPDKINAEKASRIAKLLFYLGVEIADADRRPQWNPESYRQIVAPGRR